MYDCGDMLPSGALIGCTGLFALNAPDSCAFGVTVPGFWVPNSFVSLSYFAVTSVFYLQQ